MLIKCPECELQVSDKALSCPHCGYPMRPGIKATQRRKTSKRRRLPNGFGQISEIKNRNLRKPFRAMITVGKTSTGKPICKPLKPESYFETYNDAYTALVEYNKNPYDLDPDITMQELYEKWSPTHFKTLKTNASITHFKISWKYCSSVYNMRVKELRVRHIKNCMENGSIIVGGKERKPSDGEKNRIKTLFNLMLDYAVEYEMVDRNYARDYKLPKEIVAKKTIAETPHISFTDEEIEILWLNLDMQYVDLILIQIYSGWRPQEFGELLLVNIDLINWTFSGGMKTEAGKNRVVPIHSKIRPLVVKKVEEAEKIGSPSLVSFTDDKTRGDSKFSYRRFYNRFNDIIKKLGLNPEHRLHDTRKTFVTLAKRYNVDEYAIKYMVGHAIPDITESIYTDRDDEWLKNEIEKIK